MKKCIFGLFASVALVVGLCPAMAFATEHPHSWNSTWTSDDTAHWHECSIVDPACPITSNAEKDGYAAHSYESDTAPCCEICGYERFSRTEVNDLVVTSDKPDLYFGMDTPSVSKLASLCSLSFSSNLCRVTGIHLEKWNTINSTWEPYSASDHPTLTSGGYRIIARIVIDGENGKTHKLASPLQYTWDDRADVASPTVEPGISYADIRSDHIQVFEPTLIGSVSIDDFTTPTYGAAPDCEVSVPVGNHYHLMTKTEASWYGYNPDSVNNGVIWTLNDHDMGPFERFTKVGMNTYHATFVLVADPGYAFEDALSSQTYINGDADYFDRGYVLQKGKVYHVSTSNFKVYEPFFKTAIKAGSVSVRKSTSTESERIGGLKKDDVVDVVFFYDTNGDNVIDWYEIAYGTGVGYVMVDLTYGSPKTSVIQPTAYNVRAEASTSSERIGGLIEGQKVPLLELIDLNSDGIADWGKIIYNDRVGYIVANALSGDGMGGESDAEALVAYSIEEGDNQTSDGSGDVTIKADGDISGFLHLEMDSEVIDPANYDIAEGSTIATLHQDYLATLAPGAHTLSFVYTDGKADARINVADPNVVNPTESDSSTDSADKTTESSAASLAKTGDRVNVMPFAALLGISGAALIGVVFYRRKTMR